MHGGTIPVRTHLRGPRTSLCLLDDPVTFAINEDHAPKIRSCKDRPLCEAREDEIAHSMRRPLANTLVRSFRARLIAMVALYTVWYNYVKQHKSLGGLSPAMAAGICPTLWSMTELAEMIDTTLPKGGPRGPYKVS